MIQKELVLGCDGLVFGLMTEVIKFLEKEKIPYTFVGVECSDDDTPYPLIAKEVATRIIESGYTKEGILICGTGIGMSISANKFPGIYAALVSDIYAAERARLSNNANVICLGGLVTTPTLAKKYIKEWLGLEYAIGRSQPKLDVIKQIEHENFCRDNS